jgi:hypothetical protein
MAATDHCAGLDLEAKLETGRQRNWPEDYAERIRQAITAYQEAHSLSNLRSDLAPFWPSDPGGVDLPGERGVRRLNRAFGHSENSLGQS